MDNSCQLCTDERYKDYIKNALGIKENGNLSQTSLEVLAVIAYNQPVTKAYVEQVRGVDCSYPISSLCDKNLIRRAGHLDVPGRPILYETTEDFLRCFGLSSLGELPYVELMLPAESTGAVEA
ncbi:MAG: SMC-Scp complex subunit ScpB, partial [Clostridia bacterium]|nr:SMC-Scp complex subunit ScpB [Clostridia bacterium]